MTIALDPHEAPMTACAVPRVLLFGGKSRLCVLYAGLLATRLVAALLANLFPILSP